MELLDKNLPGFTANEILAQMYKETSNSKGYKDKNIEQWTWADFLEYWDARYQVTLGIIPPARNKRDNPKFKGMIEPSREHWGNSLFKSMIDFVFSNLSVYPQWKNITIGLICGSHYWAEEISRKAQEQRKML
jgi:hypothetical protein